MCLITYNKIPFIERWIFCCLSNNILLSIWKNNSQLHIYHQSLNPTLPKQIALPYTSKEMEAIISYLYLYSSSPFPSGTRKKIRGITTPWVLSGILPLQLFSRHLPSVSSTSPSHSLLLISI